MITNDSSRRVLALLIAMFFVALLFVYHGDTTTLCDITFREENISGAVSTFPTSLLLIDEQAFAGTLLKRILFNDGLSVIKSHAFEDVVSLETVFIPASVKVIDKYAFTKDITIYGEKGSYAQEWAKENNYSFACTDIWYATLVLKNMIVRMIIVCFLIILPSTDKIKYRLRRIQKTLLSMRPQDRIDIYPINYKFP